MMLVSSLIFELVLCVTNDLRLKGLNSSVIFFFFFTDLNDNFKWDKENNKKRKKKTLNLPETNSEKLC